MPALRLGIVEFLNTRPLVAGLEHTAGVELIGAVPSRLASMVLEGRVDLGLVSLVDAAAHAGELVVVPAGMIGCDGPTQTVGLFSRVPFDRVTTLSVDADSHTSVVLAQLILSRVMGVTPEVVPFDARAAAADDDWPQTALLIGDKVLTSSLAGHDHRLDLGSAWAELTDEPFVYAVWMCRADRASDPAIAHACALLDHQLRHNLTRLDHIAASWAAQHDWPVAKARHYLSTLLRYRLDDRARHAAERFIAMAGAAGLVTPCELVWSDRLSAACVAP